jgi:hypothetical protein
VKRSNFALSVLLVPALVMAGGGGGTGCTGGGSNPTPPTLSLPTTVTGSQSPNAANGVYTLGGATTYSFTLNNLTSGTVPATGNYNVWCTNPNTNGSTLNDTYNAYNSYSYSSYTGLSPANPNLGLAGPVYSLGGSLTLPQEWNAVNWILNNPSGNSAVGHTYPTTVNDVQGAIWQLLHPDPTTNNIGSQVNKQYVTDQYSALLYFDAVTYGTAFIPGNGQLSAVILSPTSATDQGVLVPVIVTGGGCTANSGVALYKAASVTSANAFQAITYGYLVVNTGSTTLTNIVVTDDNGTPGYSEDDFQVGTIASLAPGAYQYLFANVYLPVHFFAQVGNNAIFDTLIPQVPPTTLASGTSLPAGSLVLTYLEDNDVFDNTYGANTVPGTGASAGWSAVGGHELWQDLGNYLRLKFYDSNDHLVSDFESDYLTFFNSTSQFPSEFGSAGLHGPMLSGSSSYVQYITSTLADNLNGYPKFYTPIPNGATAVSPENDVNWQSIGGYKVQVSQSIFNSDKCKGGGFGYVVPASNYINYSKLGSNLSYCPKVIGSKIVSTAWLTATVCGCNQTICAKASVCVTLNGCGLPTCGSLYPHKCLHQDECRCTCDNCLAGKHNQCTQKKCQDPRCVDEGCPQQGGAAGTKCNISSGNVYGLCQDGSKASNGGLDNNGYSYSSPSLGSSLNWAGCSFSLPAAATPGCVSGSTIALPSGNYASLKCLATGVNGNQYNQTFVVTYTDGTTSSYTQNLSDWCTPQNFSGEAVAANTPYRCTPSGGTQTSPSGINLYGYSFPLNSAKTVKSVTLPNNRNVVVSAISCQ